MGCVVGFVIRAALKAVIVPLSENQKIALASFAYNIGPTGFRNSDVVKILNTGDYQKAADELEKYIKGWEGLKYRRQREK